MRIPNLKGPFLILLWQTAPITTEQDSLGRTRVHLGYGKGAYENIRMTCDGAEVTPVDYDIFGTRIDYWAASQFRVSGYAGGISASERPLLGASGSDAFVGAAAAYEARYIGLGLGLTRLPLLEQSVLTPGFYLRAGNIDRLHFRTDLLAPSEVLGSTGMWRLGVGFNAGHLRGMYGFGGVSLCHYCWSTIVPSAGFFLDGGLPVWSRGDLTLSGMYGPGFADESATYVGDRIDPWSLGIGLRLHLGDPPRPTTKSAVARR